MRKIKIGDREYEIHYGQNAICALEDELQEPITETLKRINKGKAKLADFRAIIWAGMLKGRRDFTPEIVGELIESAEQRVVDMGTECMPELVSSFRRYIVNDSGEEKEEPEKND